MGNGGPLRQLQVPLHVVLVAADVRHFRLGLDELSYKARLRLLLDRILIARTAAVVGQLLPISLRFFIVEWARAIVPFRRHELLFRGLISVEVGSWTALPEARDVGTDLIIVTAARALRRRE